MAMGPQPAAHPPDQKNYLKGTNPTIGVGREREGFCVIYKYIRPGEPAQLGLKLSRRTHPPRRARGCVFPGEPYCASRPGDSLSTRRFFSGRQDSTYASARPPGFLAATSQSMPGPSANASAVCEPRATQAEANATAPIAYLRPNPTW